MMKPKYELFVNELGGEVIKRIDEDGSIWFIPINESNSDYQVYLASLDDAAN